MEQQSAAAVIINKRIANLEKLRAGGITPSSLPSNPVAAVLMELRAILELINLGQCVTMKADGPGVPESTKAQELGLVY